MKRRRWLLVALLVGAAGACALWAVLGGGRQTVVLPAGTRLTLRGVQVGTNCSYNYGNPLQRMVGKLPWKWVKDYSARTTMIPLRMQVPNLVLWLSSTSPMTESALRNMRFCFVHDDGTNTVTMQSMTSRPAPSGDYVSQVHTAFWPRRSRGFVVQAFAAEAAPGAKPVWEFRVRNPAYGKYPQWQPEVLPARRTVGDTTFILEELAGTESSVRPDLWRRLGGFMNVEARLRIRRDGQDAGDWGILGMQFRDATGNRVGLGTTSAQPREDGLWRVQTGCPLLAGEAAGKLGVGFGRTTLDTNDVFVLTGVPLTGSGRTSGIYTNALVGRVYVSASVPTSLRSLTRAVATQPGAAEEFTITLSSLETRLRDISEPDARRFVPLFARDDLGRTFRYTNAALDYSRLQRIRIPGDAKTVDLTLAAPRVVFVEYTVGRESITDARKQP